MRRLLAAAGMAALSLAIVVPIARAAGPNPNDKVEWWTPYDQKGDVQPSTAPDGSSVYDTDELVTVRLTFPDGVTNWKITLQPEAGGAPSSCAESYAKKSDGTYPAHLYVTCPWDTTRAVARTLDQQPGTEDGDQNPTRNWHLSDQGPSVNGKYTIQVEATSAGGCIVLFGCYDPTTYRLYEDPKANPPRWRQVWVVNGIADPTGVNSAFDAGTNRINVTWAPNPEPDVSYLVQEKVGDGKWSAGVSVPGSATNYVRTIDQPGKYQYQVAAVRPAPTDKNAAATKTSNYVAAGAVTVDQVSPPTTAGGNGPDGTIDHSGDNGVFLPTDPTASTAPGSHGSQPGKGTSTSAAGRSSVASGGARSPSRATGSTTPAGGEAEGEGADGGFSSTLPYTQPGSADGLGDGEEQPESMSKLVNVPRPQDARALLIPMAGALVVFMLAMQLMVWVRRRPAMATTSDDFDDWMGF